MGYARNVALNSIRFIFSLFSCFTSAILFKVLNMLSLCYQPLSSLQTVDHLSAYALAVEIASSSVALYIVYDMTRPHKIAMYSVFYWICSEQFILLQWCQRLGRKEFEAMYPSHMTLFHHCPNPGPRPCF